METKLLRKDILLIIACVIIAAISTYISINNFSKAFPEASINFKVTKTQSKQIAQEFLDRLGFETAGYRHAAIFDYDGNAKTFLEKELGAEKANELMGSQVRLWRWSNRWYKPLQKKEISVRISPEGNLVGFGMLLPEEEEGAFLSADSAKNIALSFLIKEMGFSADDLEFAEQADNERPHRMDHTFIWKKAGWKVADADYRYSVVILGNQLGGYSEYLHVPDEWSRSYQKLRSRNETTGLVAALFLLLTVLAMLVVLIQRTRRADVKWKTALYFGLIAAVLSFLSNLNEIPVSLYYYKTTDPFFSYMLRRMVVDLINSLLTGFLIFFVTASAEPLYRERYRNKISLTGMFSWKGLRTKRFFISVIVGLTLTFFFVAYQVVFYLTTQKFGGWSPQDIPYDNMLNTAFPWISVLLIGFLPAVSEEFISRMFSIPFFEKIVKHRWLAVVIPAFIWGFAHANYPQQPFYIRGLEVGIAGIIIGYVMLRFGILATLVWHYTVDALYTALLLLRSDNPYFVSTAAIGCGIMLLPLVVALVAYLKNRTFIPPDNLLNEKEQAPQKPAPEPKIAPDVTTRYSPLPIKRIVIGLGIAVVLALTALIKVDKVGDFVKFRHTKQEARVAATDFLQSLNYDVSDYNSVVFASERFGPLAAKYVLEQADIKRLNKLFSEESKGSRWGVRFYKPLQKEEYSVFVDPRDLSIVSFTRTLDEKAEGANLPQDSARVLAEQFAAQQGINVAEMDLKYASSNKRDHRTDHDFIWEANEGDHRNIGELKYRVSVNLQGDKISTFTVNPKLPENWERERSKQTLVRTFLLIIRVAAIGFLLVFAVIRFVREARLGHILWKKPIIVAVVLSLISLAAQVLDIGLAARMYPTSIDPSLFRISTAISLLISSLLPMVFITLSLSFLSALYPGALDALSPAARRSLGRDALAAAVINIVGLFGLQQVTAKLDAAFSHHLLVGSLSLPGNIDSLFPALPALSSSLTAAVLAAALLGIVIFIVRDLVKKALVAIPLIFVALLAFMPLGLHTYGEALLAGAKLFLLGLWLFGLVYLFMRNNFLAYIFVPLASLLALNGATLLKQPNSFFVLNGGILIFLLLLVSGWILWPPAKNRGSN